MPEPQPLKAVRTGSATGPPASAESDIRRRPTRMRREGTSKRARENQRLLAQHHRDRNAASREQLVCRLLPLARSIARRYAGGPEPFDDLVQVASLGLIKAIDRFEVESDRELLQIARHAHRPALVAEVALELG